jgi:hypothetical protein
MENKNPSIHIRDEGFLRGTTLLVQNEGSQVATPLWTALVRANGRNPPPAIQMETSSLVKLAPFPGVTGEFSLFTDWCSAGTLPGFHLAFPARWQMAYYSCYAFVEDKFEISRG